MRKIGSDSGLNILDNIASPKDTLTTEFVNLKMPVYVTFHISMFLNTTLICYTIYTIYKIIIFIADVTHNRFKSSLATNLADIMDNIGLSEIMAHSADYSKMSAQPVKVDAINHKVGTARI